MGSWERERRHQGPDQEEEPLLRRGPSPGKRSLTHRFIGADGNDSAGEAPAESGMAPASHVRAQVEATTGGDLSAARVHTGAESQAEASALRARSASAPCAERVGKLPMRTGARGLRSPA